MKNTLAVLSTLLMLSGCSANSDSGKNNTYAELSDCDLNVSANNDVASNKNSFIDLLSAQARGASADKNVTDTRLKILQMAGWREDVSHKIVDCRVERNKLRVDLANRSFIKLKQSTTNPEEKKALIDAYSAWEVYTRSLNDLSRQDFESKISFYKNI